MAARRIDEPSCAHRCRVMTALTACFLWFIWSAEVICRANGQSSRRGIWKQLLNLTS